MIIERYKMMITDIPTIDPKKLSCTVFRTPYFIPDNEAELKLNVFFTHEV